MRMIAWIILLSHFIAGPKLIRCCVASWTTRYLHRLKSLFMFLGIKMYYQVAKRTVVGLSARPAPLIILNSLQFMTFWSQSKALFMMRCMLSVGSEFKMFGTLKVTILCQIF